MSGHINRRKPASRILVLSFAVLCGFPLTTMALDASICKGPASLEQTLAAHPSPGAYEALGTWFATQRQFSCAATAFESATRLDPNSWQSHYDLGIALLSSGKFSRAAAELQNASGLKPGSEQILLPLGAALSDMNQQDEAIKVFNSDLKMNPQSVKALDGLTKSLIAEKRYTAAIAELKNAPLDEVLQLNLAVAYSKNGDTDDALKTVSAIVKEHPDYAQAQFNLGVIYTQQDRFGEAAQAFQEALRLDPSNDVTRLTYVKTLVVLAQFETAAPIIRDYLRRHPHDFDALYFAGVVEKGLGNNLEAERALRQAVAIDPNHFDVRYNLGFVLAHLGRPEEAKSQLEAALEAESGLEQGALSACIGASRAWTEERSHQGIECLPARKAGRYEADLGGRKSQPGPIKICSPEIRKEPSHFTGVRLPKTRATPERTITLPSL